MFKTTRRLVAGAIMLYALTVLVIAGFAALMPSDTVTKTDAIVVLGAGMDADGTLHRSSILRVEKGVELWKAGIAPMMHFTGGQGTPGGASAGEQMAKLAMQMGVPPEATTWESLSQSTLQNALFSQLMLEHYKSLTLVTEGFHLPRAWASFRWAGDQTLSLAYSERFRSVSPNSKAPQISMVLREALAFWFNLARALAYGLAGLFGVADAQRKSWLA
ncbi:MAG: YdcF family protein [Deltaproteobacteria bacterium]